MKGPLALLGVASVGAPLSLLLLLSAAPEGAQAATGVPSPTALRTGTVPAVYEPMLAKAARTCSLITAPVLAAQIHAESNWKADAVSPDGAQGLSQFMPGTWREIGRDGNGDGRANPLDPADAIATQAVYDCALAEQIKGFRLAGDQLDLTLAAYNAGAGAVQNSGGIPPYPETQTYVRRIRSLIATYAAVTGDGQLVHPLAGQLVITAAFGGHGTRWSSRHTGVDFRAAVGRPVLAAAEGVVTAAGPVGGRNAWAGQWVRIDHGSGDETIYAHLSAWNVTIGQHVTASQRIGSAGQEGNTTGPHLHFEVRTHGEPVNPIDYYAARGVGLR